MTDKELTIWEHLDSVMRVLTSKEMGAWLYRRDKRVLVKELEKIKSRLNHRAKEHLDGDYYVRIRDINEVFDEELAELKGENK